MYRFDALNVSCIEDEHDESHLFNNILDYFTAKVSVIVPPSLIKNAQQTDWVG